MMALMNERYRYHLGLIEYDYDGTLITDDWKAEGAKTRNEIYKDMGLKVQVTREESWVEIGGSTFCPLGNYS